MTPVPLSPGLYRDRDGSSLQHPGSRPGHVSGGQRRGEAGPPPSPAPPQGFVSHSCCFSGDSAFGLCTGRTWGRRGCSRVGVRPGEWLDGCWHRLGPIGTRSTSCNIGKFPNNISCAKSQGCDSAETWLYNWICQKPVTLNVQLPTRRAAPQRAVRPALALPLSLPSTGRALWPQEPCPEVPITPTHHRNIPNRCCPARHWEWLQWESCSSHPSDTSPQHPTCQELSLPSGATHWEHPVPTGAPGCSCRFLYKEAGDFAPTGHGTRCPSFISV